MQRSNLIVFIILASLILGGWFWYASTLNSLKEADNKKLAQADKDTNEKDAKKKTEEKKKVEIKKEKEPEKEPKKNPDPEKKKLTPPRSCQALVGKAGSNRETGKPVRFWSSMNSSEELSKPPIRSGG